MLKGKVLIAQGGGPTAVINQSLVGAVTQARRLGVEGIYGAMHGVNGILNENFVDLAKETESNLENIALTPCSALGSTRDKPDLKYCREIFKVLEAHEIGSFFYIGGNDSSDTLRILSEQAQNAHYTLRCFHIPKTIDNDLMVNDHTPGYPSAAKFVASAFSGVNLDNRALPGVYIGVVMGRHAGFLTAASALARKYPDDGPHLIYLPERKFDIEDFTDEVYTVYQKYGRCVAAISEGIHDGTGTPILSRLKNNLDKDAHGNLQLSGTGALADLLTEAIKSKTNIKRIRGDTFGYLQRSFLGCASEVDMREAREVGLHAIQFASTTSRDGSVTIHRTGNYKVDYRLSELSDIAAQTKVMDDNFIKDDAKDITPEFIDYARPLVGRLDEVTRLNAPMLKKILQ